MKRKTARGQAGPRIPLQLFNASTLNNLTPPRRIFDALPLLRAELEFLGCNVFLEMRARRCTRDRQHGWQTTDLVEKLRAQNVACEELIISPMKFTTYLRWSDWVRFRPPLATAGKLWVS